MHMKKWVFKRLEVSILHIRIFIIDQQQLNRKKEETN